jgi:adenylate cyclase
MMRVRRPPPAAILACAFALLGCVWGGYLGWHQVAGISSPLDRLEYLTVDWRFALRGPQPAPRGVVIAAIDEATIREAGGYPLPRGVLARMVRALAGHEPQAVALDILFLDPDKPDTDLELGNALRATRSVVAAVGLFEQNEAQAGLRLGADPLSLVPEPSKIIWPIAAIGDSVRIGLVNISTDQSGVPRYIPAIYRTGDSLVPSFALAASSAALNTDPGFGDATLKLAARTVRMDLGYHLPVSYYGPRGTIRQFSAVRLLRDDLDPNEVRGQVVVMGATGLGLGDKFATPFDRVMPGVEVLATVISNLLAGEGLVKTKFIRMADAAAAMLLPAATVILMAIPRPLLGFALAGLVLFGWSVLTFVTFTEGYWLSVAVPLAAFVPVTAGYGAARVLLDRSAVRRHRAESEALTKFQSPEMVGHILKNPRFLERPVHQNVGVVFLDLSGFTEVAEALGPHWARDMLADFHALVEKDVVAHDGYVVSFMGDGAMTLFGLPEPAPDDASRALRAAMALRESVASWLAGLPPVAKERLSGRISGHYGPAVVSRLGPAHHQHITATGDTVNVTSRLLEVAKQQRAGLVVSQDLYAAAGASGAHAAGADDAAHEVPIRGRREPLNIRVWPR